MNLRLPPVAREHKAWRSNNRHAMLELSKELHLAFGAWQ